MTQLLSQVKLALRSLRRSPGFALAAIASLALGIGATTAIFSVVNAVLLRPLPYGEPDRLVRVYTEFPNFPNGGLRRFWTSGPEFIELKRDLKSWQTLDAWRTQGVNLAGTSVEPARVAAAMVSGTLMQTLETKPVIGRLLSPEDDGPGVPRTVVISSGLWQSAFGGDPKVLGREVLFDGVKTTIVGVMPKDFQFPPGETVPAEVWTPLQLDPTKPGNRGGHGYYLLGRLKPGVSLEAARQEALQYESALGSKDSMKEHFLHPKNHPLVMYGLQSEVTGSVRPALLAMFAAVCFVLLIACGNVANLLLARAESRQREIAVRRAMGASAVGLIQQFLVEGVLLSLCGAAAGLVFAYGALKLILAAAGSSLPRAAEIGLDPTVLGFTVLLSLLTGVFFGLAPLAQSLPRALSEALKAAGGRTTATKEAHLLRRLMITSEVALALVLLIGAGLMFSAFWKLQAVNTGLQPENVVTLRLALPANTYSKPAEVQQFWEELQRRVRSLPGVESASVVSGLAPVRPIDANDTEFEGFQRRPGGPLQNVDFWNVAGHNYFQTMGIQLMDGRLFTESDGANTQPVLVVNQTLASVFYPGQSAIGKRIRPGFDGPWFTVVGVVADVKNAGLDKPAGTELYFPLAQTDNNVRGAAIVVRSQRDPMQLVSAIRAEVRSLDPALPLSNVKLMTDVIAQAQARPRFLVLLIGLFSAVALGLAALGIYSVMAYSVAQRTNEFGIRMAMGAEQSDVLRLVLRQGLLLGLSGVLIGAAGALALNRILKDSLYGVGAFEPLPFLGMSLLLVLVTVLACLAPALRATRVDPVVALRYE